MWKVNSKVFREPVCRQFSHATTKFVTFFSKIFTCLFFPPPVLRGRSYIRSTAAKYTRDTLREIERQGWQNSCGDEIAGKKEEKSGKTVSRSRSGHAKDRFLFLRTLLQNKELNFEDVIIIATSLFVDGLSTVRTCTSLNE